MTSPVVDAQPLVDAVKAAIAAQGVAVGDGDKPAVGAGRPWVVMWPDGGTVENRSLASRDGFSMVVTFHSYGLDPKQVRAADARLRAAVLGMHLDTVDGRTVQMPEHLIGVPMSRDDNADPRLWVQVDEWRFRLTR